MTYDGMAAEEACMRTKRPAKDNLLAFHPKSFYFTLSRMKL